MSLDVILPGQAPIAPCRPARVTIPPHLIQAFAAHQLARGFSLRTIDRRIWSLGLLAVMAPFAEHTPASIERFLSRWPSAQSRYSIRSDCHQFYKWAIRRGHLDYDPTLEVDPPRLPRRAPTPVSPVDLRELLRVAATRDQLVAISLAAFAGLRVSEIAALEMVDVDREARILVVRNGKGGRDDVLPLADELAAVLPDNGPAVSYATGAAVSDAIRRVYRRAGVRARRPHDLRASFGTAAARRAQGNMRLVQRLMRHASVTSTERYVSWNPEGGEVVNGLHDAA